MSEDQIGEEPPAGASRTDEERRFDATAERDFERRLASTETRIEYLATKSDIEAVKTVITEQLANHEGRIGGIERNQGYQWMIFGSIFAGMLILTTALGGFMYYQFREQREFVSERFRISETYFAQHTHGGTFRPPVPVQTGPPKPPPSTP